MIVTDAPTQIQEIQDHVNKCIDSTSNPVLNPVPDVSRTVPTTPSSFKALLPLSSIQAFHSRASTPITDPKTPIKSNEIDSNAFSVLMSSHKENEAWKEAAVVEDRNFRPNKGNGGRRKAAFYKVLQGMPIAVDAFRYGSIPNVNAYFLT